MRRNGERIGLAGYREMLERDVEEIPDLVVRHSAADRRPAPMSRAGSRSIVRQRESSSASMSRGKRVSFAENVFYEFKGEKIETVWSIIDKATIEAQLQRQE